MKSMVKWVSTITIILLISLPVSYGKDKHGHERKADTSGIESLSPELRELLSKEMLALQNGMMSIIPAYASGNWSKIENIGKKIEGSYILKQSITEEQIRELHSLLPESFIKLDRNYSAHIFSDSQIIQKSFPALPIIRLLIKKFWQLTFK